MADQADRGIEFWQRTFNKVFWLGVAGVVALAINTAFVVSSKSRKSKKKDKTVKNEKVVKLPSRKDSFDPLAGMARLNLEATPDVRPSRKGSMIPNEHVVNNHLIHRIVFTGGPCGGSFF
jgi:hypothetical protein